MELTIKKLDGSAAGTLQVSDDVFDAPLREALLYQVRNAYLANKRQGTQSVLTREEVRGGGKKPWRQKHTGRARQGSIRSPQWRHGGVVFAPKPRDYRQALSKEVRRQALLSALTDKVRAGAYTLVEDLGGVQAKTREFEKLLGALGIGSKCLVVNAKPSQEFVRAARNIARVRTTPADTLNALEVLTAEHVLLTTSAVQRIEELWAKRAARGKSAQAA
jgi:large subunit ribosomal protein L4